MEKLIELLNEAKPLKKYKEYWHSGNEICLITYAKDYGASESRNITLDVISKSFGFIKWLVENDKIDTDPIRTRVKRVYVELEPREFTPQDFTDRVIMLLSISDTPIEDLISYLK